MSNQFSLLPFSLVLNMFCFLLFRIRISLPFSSTWLLVYFLHCLFFDIPLLIVICSSVILQGPFVIKLFIFMYLFPSLSFFSYNFFLFVSFVVISYSLVLLSTSLLLCSILSFLLTYFTYILFLNLPDLCSPLSVNFKLI